MIHRDFITLMIMFVESDRLECIYTWTSKFVR